MKAGRNDPCPCGSGKKFKKCCMGKVEANPVFSPADSSKLPLLSPRPAQARSASQLRPEPEPPPPPPRPRTPEEERAHARWQEFESQDAAGRVAVFLRTLDEPELMDDELAFEMLSRLHDAAVKSGQRARFAELVAALRERLPEVYQKSAHFYLDWCLQDALAEERSADVLPLARELAARAGRDIDIVKRGLDALAYHGQQAVLVEVMRLAWPDVQTSSDIVPWGTSEFAEEGVDYEIFDYLEHTPVADPTSPALLDRVRFFIPEPRLEYVEQFVNDLAGRDVPAWKTADFNLQPPRKKRRDDWDDDEEEEEEPADPGAHNLSRLITQFVGYLRREEGVPYSKGELVRRHLFEYFVRRFEGDLDPRPGMLEKALHPNKKLPPPPKPIHPLCFERVTLDVHLAGLLGFFNALYHVAAALFEVVPAWLRFLESRGLIDADLRKKNLEELGPLRADLLKGLQNYSEDPTLQRDLQAWPGEP